ncbi:MAG: hypothetical protein KDA96_17050, partial [Planctomycetaceae bacterium]|nr:hypothetical protein [Planctomycetaceae bacterium]
GRAPRVAGPVRLWDVETGSLLQTLECDEHAYQVSWSSDGQHLEVAYRIRRNQAAGSLRWTMRNGRLEPDDSPPLDSRWPPTIRLIAPRESPRGTKLIDSFRSYSSLAVYSSDGELEGTIDSVEGMIEAYTFRPNGAEIAYADGRPLIQLRRLENGLQGLAFRGHDAPILFVSFNDRGNSLLSGSWDGTVKIWDATQHPQFRTIPEFKSPGEVSIDAMQFANDGSLVGVRSHGGQFLRIDPATGQILQRSVFSVKEDPYGRNGFVAISEDGLSMVTRSPDDEGVLQVWNLDSMAPVCVLRGRGGALSQLAISRSGTSVAAVEQDASHSLQINVWNDPPRESPEPDIIHALDSAVQLTAPPTFAGDTVLLFALNSTDEDAAGLLQILPLEGRPVESFPMSQSIRAIAASSDGTRLLCAGDTNLQCWDRSQRQLLFDCGAPETIESVRFFAGDTRIAGASRESTVVLDAKNGRQVLQLRGPKRAYDLPFRPLVCTDPQNQYIATNQWDDTIYVWNGPTDTEPSTLPTASATRQLMEYELFARRASYSTETKLAMVRAMQQLAPDDGAIPLRLAGLLDELGDREGSEKALKDALRCYPDATPTMLATPSPDPFGKMPFVPFDDFESLTIEAWVKDFSGPIVTQGQTGDPENSIYLDLGVHGFGWESGTGTNFDFPIGHLLDEGWHHVALTFDGSIQRTFVDGMLIHARECPRPGPMTPDRPLLIAQHGGEQVRGYGIIRSVRISRSARYTGCFSPDPDLPSDDNTVMHVRFD